MSSVNCNICPKARRCIVACPEMNEFFVRADRELDGARPMARADFRGALAGTGRAILSGGGEKGNIMALATQLLIDGFTVILQEVRDNAERGEATDIGARLGQLRARIHEETGFPYDLPQMKSLFEGWSLGQGCERALP